MRILVLPQRVAVLVAALALTISAASAGAQTPVVAPKNRYTPEQDVQLGEKAAAEVRDQMPLIRSGEVQSFVDRIGQRLVAAIPSQFVNPQFRYTFEVVNASDINAFALPGGPMFVNRGMLTAAHDEGEVAGVMAHELSHVALRHGTAQAGKAQPYELGALAGAVIGAVVGGATGSIISQGTKFGIGTAFLRYSREYEKQADILGSHIMAAAGYDPRAMATLFQTIQKEGGSRSPQWLSSHPDPGNRSQYILTEAKSLGVSNPVRDTGAFDSVQADLRGMPPALTTEQIAKNAEQNGAAGRGGTEAARDTSGRTSATVSPPSSRYRDYADERGSLHVSVPDNWLLASQSNGVVRFVPEGAYGNAGGRDVFTHGMELGLAPARSDDLRVATDQLIRALSQGNPELRAQGNSSPVIFAGHQGLQVPLTNVSEATKQRESVLLTTALTDDGTLVYSIGVVPASQMGAYRDTFRRVNQSVRVGR
jgi:beta-barrel assembly-enhancing protease